MLGNEDEPLLEQLHERGALTDDNTSKSSKFRFAITLFCLLVGVFFAALDTTIVTALLSTIGSEFEELNAVSWLGTSYLVGTCAVQPIAGKISDIYGRRPCLAIGNVVFIGGCLGCGLSTSMWGLVAFRFVSGLGGGSLNTLSTVTMTDLVPLRQRGAYQGLGNLFWGTGSALGGIFGGVMADTLGWRSAFLLQVPCMAVALIVVLTSLDVPKLKSSENRIRRVDFLGVFTLVVAVGLLMFTLSTAGNQFKWSSPVIIVTLPLSVGLFLAFGWVEKYYAMEPVIPLHLMRNRTVLAASISNWGLIMSVYMLTYYLPLFFSIIKGYSAAQVGVQLLSFSVAISVGSISAGVLMLRGRYYWLTQAYCAFHVIGCVIICTFGLETPRWEYFLTLILPGLGNGGTLTTLLLAMIAAVDVEYQAVVISISYAFRSTGGTLGVALGSTVFQSVLWKALSTRISGDDASKLIDQVRRSADTIDRLPAGVRDKVLHSYLDALRAVFALALGLGILSTITAAFMREHKLHKTLDRADEDE